MFCFVCFYIAILISAINNKPTNCNLRKKKQVMTFFNLFKLNIVASNNESKPSENYLGTSNERGRLTSKA